MKKTYILGMALMAGSMSFAQVNNALVSKKSNSYAKAAPSIRPTTQNQDRATILWSDNCSAAANWTFSNNNTGGLMVDWAIEMSPAAIPVTQLAPFASATATDGFLFISSDANNSADGDGTTIDVTATTNTPIDLTGQPNVTLRFSHNYRWWQDLRTVRVSGDGGAIYTDYQFTQAGNGGFSMTGTNNDLGSGEQNSGNPELEFLDISAVAGGMSDVKIQFVYNDGDIWAWYWAVDDVNIIVKEDNDLSKGNTYNGTVGAYQFPFVYYNVPVAQIAPISASSIVMNIGSMDQTNVKYNVDVNGTVTSSAGSTIAVNATDSLFVADYTPTGLGDYIFNYSLSADAADANNANNTYNTDTVVVTDFMYARDNGNLDGGRSNAGEGYKYGNIFDIFTAADLQAISFVPHSTAIAGAQVSVILYSYDNTITTGVADAISPIASSDIGNPYILTQADIDAGMQINLKFDNGAQTLAPGTYLAVINAVEDIAATSQMVCGAAGESPAGTSFFYDESDGNWYYVTETPMVRMNFDVSLGLNDSKELTSSLNAYPNPANNNVNINFSVTEASNVAVTVVSVTGDIVYTNNLGTVSAGKYTENINTAELANGVYFYSLTVNGNVTTKKLIISKK